MEVAMLFLHIVFMCRDLSKKGSANLLVANRHEHCPADQAPKKATSIITDFGWLAADIIRHSPRK